MLNKLMPTARNDVINRFSSHKIIEMKSMSGQRGVVLIVGLIMVLLMTIVGLAAIRGSGLQENMAANMRDMNLSFQSSESALTVCESKVDIFQNIKLPEFNNTNGFLTDKNIDPTTSVVNWKFADWKEKGILTALGLLYVPAQPRCVVEHLDYPPGAFVNGGGMDLGSLQTTGDPQMFRITSISTDSSNEIRSNVQSTFKRPFQ